MLLVNDCARSTRCQICGANCLADLGHLEGYREGQIYTVLECTNCGTSVVHPCLSDRTLYEAIYDHVARVPGYSRYHALAAELPLVRNPLSYIAGVEDTYYAIVRVLQDRVSDKENTKVCEVGCGQGYLTYALARSGFDVTGIDISANAVALARQRYGDHYFCGTVADYCRSHERPDIVVASELIEHLEQPVEFVRTLLTTMDDSGLVMITTPNKHAHSANKWDTELPPVHLWWFTKTALATMADRIDCRIEFVDFTDFYRKHPDYRLTAAACNDRRPVFNRHYELIASMAVDEDAHAPDLRKLTKDHLPRWLVRKLQKLRAGAHYAGPIDDATSRSIAAVFSRKSAAFR